MAGQQTPTEAEISTNPKSPYEGSSQIVTSNVYNFETENGRTYHGYRAGTYHFPNDETELDRLDLQFEILKQSFSARNYFAPLSKPERILDVGTGTGQWAIEVADEFPAAEVQATDLSPIQPSDVPENLQFFIDDANEEDWAVPPEYFDYVHARVLSGCFSDFRDIIRKGYYYTKPGGFMESQEIMSVPYCDDGTIPADWPFLEWTKIINEAAERARRPVGIANKLKRWYEEAGFVDVHEEIFKMPMNGWPRDPHLKRIGRMSEENWHAGLSAFSMGLFSRVLSWSKDEIEVFLVNVRKCLSDKRVHAYHKVYVVWGRKPLQGEKKGTEAASPKKDTLESRVSSLTTIIGA